MKRILIAILMLIGIAEFNLVVASDNIICLKPKEGFSITLRFEDAPMVKVNADTVVIHENAAIAPLNFEFREIESISYPQEYFPETASGMVMVGPIYMSVNPYTISIDLASFDSTFDIMDNNNQNIFHSQFDLECGFNRKVIPVGECTFNIDKISFKCTKQ